MRIHAIQTSFTAGELDPLLAEREDLQFYFRGARQMRNVLPLPQGGFRIRPGLEYRDKHRNELGQVPTAGATITAPEGGTAANVADDDEATVLSTTNQLLAVDPFVIAHFDFTAAVVVDLVDIIDIKLSASSLAGEIRIQSSTDDAAWNDFGPAFNLATDARSRRRSAPAVTARYWRLARVGSTSVAATVSVAEMRFWAETAVLSPARVIPFAFSTEQIYTLIVSDRNIEVYKDGTRVGAVCIPHTSSCLPVLNWTQSIDTLLLFHPDHAPYRIFRQGGDDEWDFRAQALTNIPQFDYGGSPGGINETQRITFTDFTAADTYILELDGEITSSIAYSATASTNASLIQTALRGLDNTSAAGIIVTAASDVMTVTFAGDDGKRNWPEIRPSEISSATGVIRATTTTKGEPPGEDVISASRGWPRCGTFYQARLFLGGFKSRPQTKMASVIGEFFNFDNKTVRDDRGFMATADTDEVSAIFQMFAGRHLQIFTSGAEFYVPSEPITPLTLALKQTTRRGIVEGLRAHEVDGATLFIQRQGNALREYLFVDAEQSYQAENISLLSSHLVKTPVDTGIRRSRSTDEADFFVLVNSDGDLAVLTTLRNQNVTAFVRATTAGQHLAVGGEEAGDLYFVVERTINGAQVRHVERWNRDLVMDAGAKVTLEAPASTITGVDHLEGETVNLIIDGSPEGTAVVTGGVITLTKEAQAQVEYGLEFKPLVETMPVKLQLPDGTMAARKKRVAGVSLSLVETTSIAVGANGRPPREVPIRKLGGELLDFSMDENKFTGVKDIGGFLGWGEEGTIVITQNDPGSLTVRGIIYRVAA